MGNSDLITEQEIVDLFNILRASEMTGYLDTESIQTIKSLIIFYLKHKEDNNEVS
jgi:hypothetical protein